MLSLDTFVRQVQVVSILLESCTYFSCDRTSISLFNRGGLFGALPPGLFYPPLDCQDLCQLKTLWDKGFLVKQHNTGHPPLMINIHVLHKLVCDSRSDPDSGFRSIPVVKAGYIPYKQEGMSQPAVLQ